MKDLFRNDDPQADLSYRSVRDPMHEGAARARANCDDLWEDFEPFASEHFLAEFPYRFHQRWFEMYLAVALLRSGLKIQCPPEAAPDVRVEPPDKRVLWVEAIAPTGGDETNPDRVVYPPRRKPGEPPEAYAVPIDQVTLRVRGALYDKARRVAGYRANAVIAPDDQAVIAINVHDIPHGAYDPDVCGPGASYGLGHRYAIIDRNAGNVVDSGYQHREQILRASGAPVEVAPFLHPGHEHVTAALISSTDAANCPETLGHDFMLLPNPNSVPLYSAGQVALGLEWRLRPAERDALYRVEVVDHSHPPDRRGPT